YPAPRVLYAAASYRSGATPKGRQLLPIRRRPRTGPPCRYSMSPRPAVEQRHRFARPGVLLREYGTKRRSRLSASRGVACLPGLSDASLAFGPSTLGLGGVRISRCPRASGLDRTASGLLAKLARLLTTTFVTPAARGARDERDEQYHHHGANSNCDDRSGAH